MSNLWSCTDYEILKVEEKNDKTEYKVTFQRLPTSTYSQYTIQYFLANEADESNVINFPSNLSVNDFIANAIPKVNSYIVDLDAEFIANPWTVIS